MKPHASHRWGPADRALAYVREHFFGSWTSALATLAFAAFALWIGAGVVEWAIFKAVWHGETGEVCRRGQGAVACWPFISAKWPQFVYGTYPEEARWRVNLTFALGAAGLAWLMLPRLRGKVAASYLMVLVYPLAAFLLLTGKLPGLSDVPTELWGGMLITIVLAASGIALSLPLGILLALGRRSDLPLIRIFCTLFIEFWRGVPLVTVLFMASVMLPLFLPPGVTFDLLVRCIVGVVLFSSAYMAEVVRGGLQAIPRGQYEAAAALGLGYWRIAGLVVLPQALRLVIPGIVNTFIGLFKDTTLVLIVGLSDFLGMVQRNLNDANWFAPGTAMTGYAFAALVFWIFCFGMSRYATHMERVLHPEGERT